MPDHYSMGGVGSKEIDTPGPFNAMDSQKMGLTNSFSPNTYFKTSETLSKPIDFKPIDFANKGVSPRKAARIAKTQMKLQQAKDSNKQNFIGIKGGNMSKEVRMQKRLNRLQNK
jgi:Ran GTPase-activating protein (RanGAP) involved in mRNA processing and transport